MLMSAAAKAWAANIAKLKSAVPMMIKKIWLKMVKNAPKLNRPSMSVSTNCKFNRRVKNVTVGALGMPSRRTRYKELMVAVEKKNGSLRKWNGKYVQMPE